MKMMTNGISKNKYVAQWQLAKEKNIPNGHFQKQKIVGMEIMKNEKFWQFPSFKYIEIIYYF